MTPILWKNDYDNFLVSIFHIYFHFYSSDFPITWFVATMNYSQVMQAVEAEEAMILLDLAPWQSYVGLSQTFQVSKWWSNLPSIDDVCLILIFSLARQGSNVSVNMFFWMICLNISTDQGCVYECLRWFSSPKEGG